MVANVDNKKLKAMNFQQNVSMSIIFKTKLSFK